MKESRIEIKREGDKVGRQIAVLMSAINIGNQKKILEGMIDAAKETDCNLFVFTCHINYNEKEENRQGAYQIMKLPDFRYFDGAVIVRNTIQYEPTAEQVLDALKESRIPAISIDSELPQMGYIGILNYEAQRQVVEHLINVHGCRKLCYIAGPSFNEEAWERKRAFMDIVRENGIGEDPRLVLEGMWDEESGRKAVDAYLKNRECPDAFVCANDLMAIGAIQELQKKGYHVPEDVYVTGFDNENLVGVCTPSLTSVDKNQYNAGRKAVLELFRQRAAQGCTRVIVPAQIVLRESCGCEGKNETSAKRLCEQYVQDRLRTQKVADMMKNMISDFSGMEQPEELIEALKKYIVQTDMEKFYLCLCEKEKLFGTQTEELSGNMDIENVNTDYTKDVMIPLAYEKGAFQSYGLFYKGQVLPDVCRNESGGNFYIVNPIYYQRCCYGYCISGNSRFPLEDGLYYTWLMNIGIGLENIRKLLLLKGTVVKLNRMWMYDMLSHLYNRSGFFHFAAPMLVQMRENDKEVFLLFMDIDGLKAVNDTQGHELGDVLISTMAEIIRKCINEDELAMRYGGDEFVVIGETGTDDRLGGLTDRIREEMTLWNKQNDIFFLSASIGGSKFRAVEIENLNKLIEQADRHMYEEKRKKKQ